MDKTIRRVTDVKAQRQESYEFWRNRSGSERMNAIAEIVRDTYLMKGVDLEQVAADKKIVRIVVSDWKAT
jgi:hypothetical protein